MARVNDVELELFNRGHFRIAENPDLIERIAFDLRDLRAAARAALANRDKAMQILLDAASKEDFGYLLAFKKELHEDDETMNALLAALPEEGGEHAKNE